MKRKVLWLI